MVFYSYAGGTARFPERSQRPGMQTREGLGPELQASLFLQHPAPQFPGLIWARWGVSQDEGLETCWGPDAAAELCLPR